jgi:hypothetical protein
VLDAPAGQAPRELREVELVGYEISLEVPVELASEERHHVARLEVERAAPGAAAAATDTVPDAEGDTDAEGREVTSG